MQFTRLIFALSLALLLHVAIAAALLNDAPDFSSASGTGDAGFEIGLGLAGSYIDSIDQPTSEEPPVEEPIEKPVAKKVEPAPKPIVKPTPKLEVEKVEAVIEQDNADATQAVIAPEDKPAPEIPEPEETSQQEELSPEVAPAESAQQSSADNKPIDPDPPSAALQRATGASNDSAAGGRQGKTNNYFTDLMAWLNQHKRYPRDAKKEKQQGVVELQFTVQRNGTVVASSIKKSSGYPLLDAAALNMLQSASPVPALPASMDREQVTIVIPIEFSLITNNRYKE